MPEIDPGPSETYRQLCVELDNHRHQVRDEIRRRADEQGVFKAMEDLQDRGISDFVGKMLANLGHRSGSEPPEHAHEIQLALRELNVFSHGSSRWWIRRGSAVSKTGW